ncbi:hypothetical protein VTN31DRAFT_3773 [Thermomyces dupontii]|uniref:uncharacterized protein n=1 Tax=Talaromyces thermophilus TaxID=28565 RepID=UPI0037424839
MRTALRSLTVPRCTTLTHRGRHGRGFCLALILVFNWVCDHWNLHLTGGVAANLVIAWDNRIERQWAGRRSPDQASGQHLGLPFGLSIGVRRLWRRLCLDSGVPADQVRSPAAVRRRYSQRIGHTQSYSYETMDNLMHQLPGAAQVNVEVSSTRARSSAERMANKLTGPSETTFKLYGCYTSRSTSNKCGSQCSEINTMVCCAAQSELC